MTLTHPNPSPRFAAAVAPLLPDIGDHLALADIGARYGLPALWHPLRSIARTVGFEPAVDECEQINQALLASGATNDRIYPYAIAGRTGRHRFYVTQLADSAGLYRGNPEWTDRFPMTTLRVLEEIEVEAVSLDDFCHEQKIARLDFLKIDVEGAEHDVLTGAAKLLSAPPNILGLQTEFWWDPIIKGQAGFAEIDLLLRSHGLRFFDLKLHRYPRSTLASGRLQGEVDAEGVLRVHTIVDQEYGQSWTGDALYFRDPVGDLRANKLSPNWTAEALLRLCALYDIYDYGDCAIEVLEYFADSLLKGVDVSSLMDALVPPIEGILPTYGSYRSASNQVRQTISETYLNLSDWVPPPTHYRNPANNP